YSQTLTGNAGSSPYTFAVTSGALPDGLSLASDGTLSGTPTTAGGFTFAVTATDPVGCTGSGNYNVNICSALITISPASLPGGTIGESYSQTLTASGGTAPYTFAVTSGALPDGLSLASDGTLSGTPTTEGNLSFTVTATDSGNCTGSASYGVRICPA